MKTVTFNLKKTIITFFLYWLLISINVSVSTKYGLTSMVEWWMNTFVFLLFMLTFLLTYNERRSLLYKLIFIPVSWFTHAILTIPSAYVLGVLMFNQNHIRTMGEHRAVFILASLPIFFFGITKSKLFSNEISKIKY